MLVAMWQCKASLVVVVVLPMVELDQQTSTEDQTVRSKSYPVRSLSNVAARRARMALLTPDSSPRTLSYPSRPQLPLARAHNPRVLPLPWRRRV